MPQSTRNRELLASAREIVANDTKDHHRRLGESMRLLRSHVPARSSNQPSVLNPDSNLITGSKRGQKQAMLSPRPRAPALRTAERAASRESRSTSQSSNQASQQSDRPTAPPQRRALKSPRHHLRAQPLRMVFSPTRIGADHDNDDTAPTRRVGMNKQRAREAGSPLRPVNLNSNPVVRSSVGPKNSNSLEAPGSSTNTTDPNSIANTTKTGSDGKRKRTGPTKNDPTVKIHPKLTSTSSSNVFANPNVGSSHSGNVANTLPPAFNPYSTSSQAHQSSTSPFTVGTNSYHLPPSQIKKPASMQALVHRLQKPTVASANRIKKPTYDASPVAHKYPSGVRRESSRVNAPAPHRDISSSNKTAGAVINTETVPSDAATSDSASSSDLQMKLQTQQSDMGCWQPPAFKPQPQKAVLMSTPVKMDAPPLPSHIITQTPSLPEINPGDGSSIMSDWAASPTVEQLCRSQNLDQLREYIGKMRRIDLREIFPK